MLGQHDRSLAWLLLLVADMRFVLGSKLRGLLLYDKVRSRFFVDIDPKVLNLFELDAILMDQHLQQWVTCTRITVLREIQDGSESFQAVPFLWRRVFIHLMPNSAHLHVRHVIHP